MGGRCRRACVSARAGVLGGGEGRAPFCNSAIPEGGGEGWHEALVLVGLPIGLSPLLILTLCGPERVLVVSLEPPDDLSCLTTPGVGRPGDGAVAVDQPPPPPLLKDWAKFSSGPLADRKLSPAPST